MSDDEDGILPSWVISVTTAGVGGTIVDFASNPERFVYTIFIDGLLNGWAWLLENVFVRLYGVIELALVDGIAVPLSTGASMAGSSLYGAVMSVQTWTEGGLMSLGIAAPFALIVSWLVIATIVGVIFQLFWGVIETYVPVDSVRGAVEVLFTAVRGDPE